MAPRLFDDYQIANAMRNEAVPALERFAENASSRDRDLRRFDRDEPPPYVSSTEDEYDDYDDVPPLDEVTRILDEPLDNDDLDMVAYRVEKHYPPGERYNAEAEVERDRLALSARQACDNTRQYFVQYGSAEAGRAGRARVNIIVRRNIKRRWQKLGVWNPEWGIPDRTDNPHPNDDTCIWKWPWQHGDAAAEWRESRTGDPGAMAHNPRHPVTRALELRRGLRRSEHKPTIPRSRLEKDASASQAESFITSRPWFMYRVERAEEWQRGNRVPLRTRRLYSKSAFLSVKEQWEKRGDWKEEWPYESRNQAVGWKWRHESPSPEPDDYERLDDPTLDLAPSEVDALEAIRPPTPPPPRVYVPPTGSPHWLFGAPSPPKEDKLSNPHHHQSVGRASVKSRTRLPSKHHRRAKHANAETGSNLSHSHRRRIKHAHAEASDFLPNHLSAAAPGLQPGPPL